MAEKMMERYSQVFKLLDMSGGARDYQYVCSLIVTFCDINTSSMQDPVQPTPGPPMLLPLVGMHTVTYISYIT